MEGEIAEREATTVKEEKEREGEKMGAGRATIPGERGSKEGVCVRVWHRQLRGVLLSQSLSPLPPALLTAGSLTRSLHGSHRRDRNGSQRSQRGGRSRSSIASAGADALHCQPIAAAARHAQCVVHG